ncbi:MAG: glycoside hydrolase family 1 protein [Anaerolineales bacterium]|nr:glycoside hydrolase family 1 protein [Anaerolineales bacterium]
MAQATFNFPAGFLWGTATAAHQVEGNNTNNNWYVWQDSDRILDGQRAGLACDWFGGRWREDFDRAAETGQNSHRLSVEWSRIQPEPERWDEDALDYYRQMLRGLRERDLVPMVTLHHFTDPLWLYERGGWTNPEVVTHFERFTRRVVEAFQEYADLWCTINEPNVYVASSYVLGDFPPGRFSLKNLYQAMGNMVQAHAAAYHAIHELQPQAQVGLAHQYRGFQPARRWLPTDRWISGVLDAAFNQVFPRAVRDGILQLGPTRRRIPQAKNTQDFFGLNYYTRERVAFNLLKPGELFSRRFYDPAAVLSETDFIANEPLGFYQAIRWANAFQLPIYITENGIEDSQDTLRPRYLAEHIRQLWRAVNFNWPVRGYYHWTLVDNFEWERGWSQRFGLWELDVKTQTRTKRPSADLYAEICQQNALSSEMVARFAPEVFDKLFPN